MTDTLERFLAELEPIQARYKADLEALRRKYGLEDSPVGDVEQDEDDLRLEDVLELIRAENREQ